MRFLLVCIIYVPLKGSKQACPEQNFEKYFLDKQMEEKLFLLSPEDILFNSPSRKDGIDRETEENLRIYGCEIIQEAGILLKL